MLEKLVLTGRRLNPEIEQRVVNLGPPGVVGRRLEGSGVTVDSLGMEFLRFHTTRGLPDARAHSPPRRSACHSQV